MRTGASTLGSTMWVCPASVWQDSGQRISAMVDPGVARTTICHQHRYGHLGPAIRWERFALHDIAYKSRVVGQGRCHASHARPRGLILLHATDVLGRNATACVKKQATASSRLPSVESRVRCSV